MYHCNRITTVFYALILGGCATASQPTYRDVNHPANPAAPEAIAPKIDHDLHPYQSLPPSGSSLPQPTAQTDAVRHHHQHGLAQ